MSKYPLYEMPYRRKKYTKKRSKRSKGYKRRNKPYTSLRNYGTALVPDNYFAKLKYVQRLAPAPATGSVYYQYFSGNSLYDPDNSGVGHSAMGFDQIMTLYDYYQVYASKIKVTCLDNSTTAPPAQYELALIPTPTNTSAAGLDPETVRENRRGRWRIVSTHTGAGTQSLSAYNTFSQVLGRKLVESGPNTYGTSTANPTTQWFWAITAQVIDEATTMANVYFYVELIYYSRFSRSKILDYS